MAALCGNGELIFPDGTSVTCESWEMDHCACSRDSCEHCCPESCEFVITFGAEPECRERYEADCRLAVDPMFATFCERMAQLWGVERSDIAMAGYGLSDRRIWPRVRSPDTLPPSPGVEAAGGNYPPLA